MKKILIAIMLLFSTATMAQRLSVLGIEMGTSIEKAEKILNERYGEFNVYRTGNIKLSVYDALVGGSEFSFIDFNFQCSRYGNVTYTYLSNVNLQKNFKSYSGAKAMFNNWEEKLLNKYTASDIEETTYKNQEGVGCTIWYKEGVVLVLTYLESKGGEYYWYVIINYHEDIIDESNDY
jgi:hypothetical protein